MTIGELLLVAVMGLCVWSVLRPLRERMHARWAARVLADFHRDFPSRCAICSFGRYGSINGHPTSPYIPHECPERTAP